jgi:hypothetical protein
VVTGPLQELTQQLTQEPVQTPLLKPITHLLYLHGFRSSPLSFKARRLQAWLAENQPQVHWWCPQLPPSPREAMAQVQGGIAGWPESSAVVGSSLGGFYATAVAESPWGRTWRAVLINPAVDPARDLAAYEGELSAFHSPEERFYFRAAFVDELRALQAGALTARERYLPIIATGDEVLSWQEMATRCAGLPMRLVQGSDHALSDFDDHLPSILKHLDLCA